MANEQRVRSNFKAGTITNNPLLIGGTSLTSAELAGLPVIGTTEHLAISLDPSGLGGAPEIVYVTAHTTSSTTATILRAQEGTTARQHGVNTRWAHSTTTTDWDRANPVGTLAPFAGAAAPAGWLLCDGTAVSRTTYAALFAVTSTLYGVGDGSATFNLPNLKGKVVIGLDAAQTEFDLRGESGGSKTLTEAMLASHTHTTAHTHGMNTVDTDHAHNVYERQQNTGDIDRVHAHTYSSSVNSEVWTSAHDNHTHGGGGGVGSERPFNSVGEAWATGHWHTGQTSTENQGHLHNFNHDHPSTNMQSQAPWAGTYIHGHTTNSQSTSTSGAAGSGTVHLPPYQVLNYIIRY